MRKSIIAFSSCLIAFSCTSQKPTTTKPVTKTPTQTSNSTSTAPKSVTTPSKNSDIQKIQGVEFYRQNIGDASKNDNTMSHGSIVTANPIGYKVTKTYFPALGQNFRQRYLIIHYTALNDDKSVEVLTQQQVSAHYLVNDIGDKDIYQLVDENKRAYHSGVSLWRNDKNMNDNSIGIEIVNEGYVTDSIGKKVFAPFNDAQVRKVAALMKDIVDRYQIPPTNVLAHSDVAPTRKQDPGPQFPWKMLYDQYKIGMWYDESVKSSFQQKAISQNIEMQQSSSSFIFQVQTALQKFGYDITPSGSWDAENRKVVEAFQYHFRPTNYDGIVDAETWAILQALLQKYPR